MLNTINVASSGLAASRAQVENVMNNIANENTEGYKKRVVGISEASHIDARLTGRGVMIGDTERITNVYLSDNLTKEQGKLAQYNELSTMLTDVEAIFYETDDSGFSADLDRYFQALENLRTDPNNEIYKNEVRNTGKVLVDDMQNLYTDIESRETVAYNNLNDNVEELNTLLKDIGNVNKALTESVIISNDLLDKRDQLEKQLSEYIDIDVDRTGNYELKIAGITAVRFDNNVHELTVSTEYIPQKDIYSDFTGSATGEVIKVDLNNTDSFEITLTDTAVTSVAQQIKNQMALTPEIANKVTADIDASGNLVVTSKVDGDEGSFDLNILNVTDKVVVDKDTALSVSAKDDIHLEIFDKEITLKSGKIKSTVDNINTTSSDNLFTSYKQQLDNFAAALSDMSSSYIKNTDDSYVYGEKAVDVDTNSASRVDINLFSGSDVKSLVFNDGVVAGLTQDNLDYLATLQWKTDIDIDGTGTNLTSFSKYNQALRVNVSDDMENVKLKQITQEAVTESLQNNYDKLVKVDKDEEMMNLIKFQSAYEANAKLITIIDEMLSTILGMTR